MDESTNILRDIVRSFQQHSLCEMPDEEFKNELLEEIEAAEDFAFKQTAGAIDSWVCHPVPLKNAEEWAKKMLNINNITCPTL